MSTEDKELQIRLRRVVRILDQKVNTMPTHDTAGEIRWGIVAAARDIAEALLQVAEEDDGD